MADVSGASGILPAVRERQARYEQTLKGKATKARYKRGLGYLTERRRQLLAERERVTNQLEGIRHGTE